MDVRILRYFLAVAREQNITRAAESLHIAQPSLSKQLMELEKELGQTLLIRGKRKITLTEEGMLLRRRAEEITALMDKTERELSAANTEVCGEIVIGGGPTACIIYAAAALRKKHTDVRFHFFVGDATDVSEQLEHGGLDFAVFLEPIDPIKYDFISLTDVSQWGILMASDDELAQQKSITREMLRDLPLILHRRPGLQHEISRWAQCDPSQLNIVATYNVINGTPIHFIRSSLGYFLTTRDLFASQLDSSVCFRPLEPTLSIRYALAWKRHAVLSKAATRFLEELKVICAEADKTI